VLPDFIVIGTQRGGTTSLDADLRKHPQVRGARRKEVHFLDGLRTADIDRYRSYFPTQASLGRAARRVGAPVLTGESSPSYLFHPEVPARAARIVPDARFIALLREPVARAYSNHQLEQRRGNEPLDFVAAIEAEEGRLADDPAGFHRRHHSYVARGRYAEQLERWFTHVGRDRILVLRSEDLFADGQSQLDAVTDFLGLRRHHLDTLEARNLADYEREIPHADALRARFAPHNERLSELLDRDMGW